MAAILLVLGTYNIMLNNTLNQISQDKKDPNRVIESYVNACWIAKIAKNLESCKIHLSYIENQCKTNMNSSQLIACKDPRIAQMVEENPFVSTK